MEMFGMFPILFDFRSKCLLITSLVSSLNLRLVDFLHLMRRLSLRWVLCGEDVGGGNISSFYMGVLNTALFRTQFLSTTHSSVQVPKSSTSLLHPPVLPHYISYLLHLLLFNPSVLPVFTPQSLNVSGIHNRHHIPSNNGTVSLKLHQTCWSETQFKSSKRVRDDEVLRVVRGSWTRWWWKQWYTTTTTFISECCGQINWTRWTQVRRDADTIDIDKHQMLNHCT
jgi:hypothetical protein